eukprot:SM000230S07354  [mRNA]  locus=s230:120068:124665:- [translate_table: standard]
MGTPHALQRRLSPLQIELAPIVPEIKEDDHAANGSTLQVSSFQDPQLTKSEEEDAPPRGKELPVYRLAFMSMVAGGIQFGWALQLSLLTPYIQQLGISHAWASLIWLCGPISGLLVQPYIGVWSDSCKLRWGRRRPFILAGALLVSAAVTLIGFSADLGYLLGDYRHLNGKVRPYACTIFILGFWFLDLANNTVQGPSRALLADLAGADQQEAANAFYSLWISIGNILGYSTGTSDQWFRLFPFLVTTACGEACANLKAAFLFSVVFLLICTTVTISVAREAPYTSQGGTERPALGMEISPLLRQEKQKAAEEGRHGHEVGHEVDHKETRTTDLSKTDYPGSAVDQDSLPGDSGPEAVMATLLIGLRSLPRSMISILAVMALSWMAWFPFLLFDTDWMGREVYQGRPDGDTNIAALYQSGVREGALGLLLNSVVQAVVSTFIDPLCRVFGARRVWAGGNFIIFSCMAATAIVTAAAVSVKTVGTEHDVSHPYWVKIVALVIFAVLGAPLAITLSVPYSLTASLTALSGGGQGLSMGILNLAIVIPQIIISIGASPWDELFGGGNQPSFVAAAVFALTATIVAVFSLPDPPKNYRPPPTGVHGLH